MHAAPSGVAEAVDIGATSVKVYRDPSEIDDAMRGAVLTVGNFDGVHLGHQRILRTARALAQVSRAKVVAMTFEPHPFAVLRPDRAPPRLTLFEEKRHQLELAGADALVRLDADHGILSLSAEDFVKEIIIERVHPSYIVEGHDFGFGSGRRGNTDTLEAMSAKGGFQVRVVEPYRLARASGEHIIVSSTAIRELLRDGELVDANACLGRPYSLVGEVVHGAGDGNKLGFPTINLNVAGQLTPADGVYAGIVEIDGIRAAAAISIGCRPTLNGGPTTIEAHVIGHRGDWYGLRARLDVVRFLRGQVKYAGLEALIEQIGKDVVETKRMMEQGGHL